MGAEAGTGMGSGTGLRDSSSASSATEGTGGTVHDASASASSSASGAASVALDHGPRSGQYPANGIYVVSVGNDVKRTGGAFSVADTAPHRLPSTAGGYAHPFTASELPLDRPWEGPDVAGVVAFRLGCSADARTLWRLIACHDSLAIAAATGSLVEEVALAAQGMAGDQGDAAGGAGGSMRPLASITPAATAAGGAGAASSSSSSPASASATTTASTAQGVLPRLGGVSALRHLPDFPVSHRELRDRMREARLPETRMVDGTIAERESTPSAIAEASRRAMRAARVRRPHSSRFRMALPEYLNAEVGASVKMAAALNTLRDWERQKEEAARRAAEEHQVALRQILTMRAQQQQQGGRAAGGGAGATSAGGSGSGTARTSSGPRFGKLS